MIAKSSDNQVAQPGSYFAVGFIVCVISLAGLMAYVPDAVLDAWRGMTIQLARGLGLLLGLAMTRDVDILTVNGFAMRIVDQCTASNYVVILAAAMLLYTRHRLSYRLLGVAIAVPVIVLANAFRLVVTGVVGSISRSAFDLVHDYLWVIAFALLVFALWTLWVNGRFAVSRAGAAKVALVGAVSLATFLLLLVFHEAYGDLLARSGTFFYRIFSSDHQAAILRAGDQVFLSHGGTRIALHTLAEQINVAVFVGLMAPLQRWGDWEMLLFSVLGLAAMVVIGSIFIALGCSQAVASGAGGLNDFLKIGSFVNLALPMATYWIMAGEREKRDALAPSPGSGSASR